MAGDAATAEVKQPSLKKRRRALTVTSLHKPTRVQPRQAKIAQQTAGPATKRIKIAADAKPTIPPAEPDQLRPPPPPHVEASRSVQMARLRKQFTAIFKAATPGNSPDAPTAFERWHFTQMQHQESSETADPLIPDSCQQGSLVADLSRLSATPKAIRQAERALAKAAQECVKCVQKQASSAPKHTVKIVQHKHSCDILYGKVLLKINPSHLEKLRVAYHLDSSDEQAFLDAVCSLLLRYRSLGGHGFQAALNEAAMEVLLEALGVTTECFASPLNYYLPAYCSAFPDTDAAFGSRGSFLTESLPLSVFDPRVGGSFECNPPFVPEVMLRAVQQLHLMAAQCDQAGAAPFSVVFIVPGWTEDPAWQALNESELLVKRLLVSKADHGFVDGAQHQRRDRYRESPFDTGVFVLQNSGGRRKWPVRKDLEQLLRAAMAQGRPSAAAVERRLKEGRGLADADGGGGVYRGKKRQKRLQEDQSLRSAASKRASEEGEREGEREAREGLEGGGASMRAAARQGPTEAAVEGGEKGGRKALKWRLKKERRRERKREATRATEGASP